MSLGLLIKGIAHVGIRVHDLSRSRAFYEQLGFAFMAGPLGPEPVAIMKHPSGITVNFILNAPEADAPNVLMDIAAKPTGYTHIALLVVDLDAVQTHLDNAGIVITAGPVQFPGGACAIFVRDPDRNVIEFHQEASDAPA